jgi:hypothetical protein
MAMRHYARPWWNYRPQEVWETFMRNGAPPLENVSQPRTQESDWTRGTQKTNAFQENTMWISADSILLEHSSLSTESKIGFANELNGVAIEMLIAH